MKWVSASEIVIFHDRILQLYPGVTGMPDAGRAEAIIHRVHNLAHYEGVNDVFDLAAAYWAAIARGHIFNDGNKRTAFFTTMAFLRRNGVLIRDEGNTLEELTVQAATGELTPIQLAQSLRGLAE
jgi:death-on-curing protein